jgi:hypothetical protein
LSRGYGNFLEKIGDYILDTRLERDRIRACGQKSLGLLPLSLEWGFGNGYVVSPSGSLKIGQWDFYQISCKRMATHVKHCDYMGRAISDRSWVDIKSVIG